MLMRSGLAIPIAVLCCVIAAGGLWLASADDQLGGKLARDLLRHLGGAELSREQVRVKSIDTSLPGGTAIVQAQVETAIRYARARGGEWRVAEIRFGDRHWESVELILEGVRREKVRRTRLTLKSLATALEAYRRDHQGYVAADDFKALVDRLGAGYLGEPLRFDLWNQPFNYRGTSAGYRLFSAGPDQQPGTGDDLILENGQVQGPES